MHDFHFLSQGYRTFRWRIFPAAVPLQPQRKARKISCDRPINFREQCDEQPCLQAA